MKRFIVLDTETTGLNPAEGDRIVEIGCIEMLHTRRGKQFYSLINPERDIPADAVRIHGITQEKVANAPRFADLVDSFLAFIGDDTLVIHNASFDIGFLNAELARLQRPPLSMNRVIDTIPLARRKFPGLSASLDALCRRLKIDNSQRTLHGALLDADLLASVYLELTGGSQLRLELTDVPSSSAQEVQSMPVHTVSSSAVVLPVRHWPLSEQEQTAHANYLQRIQRDSGACIWLQVDLTSAAQER
ncbi:DNA polymerase III subunit epsilon [Candidatus Magnetaquicoccus inordinatus]|uniref:DNA polymerase III subunit epsilon n=1 Tax=Candidatus Magnetaquicoccus inordinatus TaxID=2496818 RepID=UPI00102C42D9|nr:DNA polymerase III subunit epsilon [Candidatus Magnetaquicoccus inordinatus]